MCVGCVERVRGVCCRCMWGACRDDDTRELFAFVLIPVCLHSALTKTRSRERVCMQGVRRVYVFCFDSRLFGFAIILFSFAFCFDSHFVLIRALF